MRTPYILALTAVDDEKALTALHATPLVGSQRHLWLQSSDGDGLVVPLGEKVTLDGLKGLYTVCLVMPHSDGKGCSEHGPAMAAKLTTATATAAEAAKAEADKTDPSILGPWTLADFAAHFPDAESKLAMRLYDADGVLRAPQIFLGDDPYELCGTKPKVKEEPKP